jgi:hypothetical protein
MRDPHREVYFRRGLAQRLRQTLSDSPNVLGVSGDGSMTSGVK